MPGLPTCCPLPCQPTSTLNPRPAGPRRHPGRTALPQVIIHRLLSMFHPRPFVKTRFTPQGAVACLTAISDFFYMVTFR